ncbi:MAG: hypothetical protein HRT88_00255 [Lentisphaeraceae bacterium]|nr:hypothetical protein [Lentisphaeraceae bacterium]
MKNVLMFCAVLLLGSCRISDALVVAGTGAVGALTHELTDGNVAATAGAAGATLLLGKYVQNKVEEDTKEAYESGYLLGRAQAAKENYWIIQRMQGENNSSGNPRLIYETYEFPGVEEKDGVNYLPHTVKLRVIKDVQR